MTQGLSKAISIFAGSKGYSLYDTVLLTLLRVPWSRKTAILSSCTLNSNSFPLATLNGEVLIG